MRAFWNMPIQRKLLAIAMITSSIAVLSAYAAFLTIDFFNLRKSEILKLKIVSQIVASNTRSAVAFSDVDSARDDLASLAAAPGILYAAIYLPDGRLFAMYGKDGVNGHVQPPSRRTRVYYLEGNYLHLFRKINLDGEEIGELYIKYDLSGLYALLGQRLGIGLIILSVCLLFAFFLSSRLQTTISGPVLALSRLAQDVAKTRDYSKRIVKQYNDEVGSLTDQFNEMLGQIQQQETALLKIHLELERRVEERTQELREAQKQAIHAEKMAAVGQLAGGIAHDFNNLMVVITGYAEIWTRDPKLSSEMQSQAREVLSAAQRCTRLTNDLLSFSRKHVYEPSVINLNDFINERHPIFRRMMPPNIQFDFLSGRDLGEIQIDVKLFEQALMGIVGNSVDAMPDGGRLAIETRNENLDSDLSRRQEIIRKGSYVTLTVKDTGAGMTAEAKKHLFEPFFSTKKTGEVGKNTGLGMAMCYGIIRQARGHIVVQSEVGLGTAVKFYFPRYQVKAS